MIHFDSPMSCSRSPVTRRAFIGGAAHIDRPGDPRRYAEGLAKLGAFAEAMNGLGAAFGFFTTQKGASHHGA